MAETYFAVAPPGLERFLLSEITALGLEGKTEPGGVIFSGTRTDLLSANLRLRTASRVLARLGTSFYARDFTELRQRAGKLPWERFLQPGQAIELRVTCHKSKLMHTDAVARRIHEAIGDRLGSRPELAATLDEEPDGSVQSILVRLVDDLCTVSIDSSGELLYKRGYRLATAKAPLRETLAAALLMASGWDKVSPLIDPFCGSGTIPIEAALLAADVPPGLKRKFICENWQGMPSLNRQFDLNTNLPPILGSDRDAGAVKASLENGKRAGVSQWVSFSHQAVSAIEPPDNATGWIITNPPYGLRISEGKDLRNLYAQFGNVLRAKFPGWQVTVLCPDLALLGQAGLPWDTSMKWKTGGVQVFVARALVGG